MLLGLTVANLVPAQPPAPQSVIPITLPCGSPLDDPSAPDSRSSNSTIPNLQSAIRNPQSEIPAPQSPKDCLTAGCHADLTKPKYLHGPLAVNECARCHQETDSENHKYRLSADPPALCFACHVKLQAKLRDHSVRPHRHQPVAEGKCLDCHDPHASGQPMMLRTESQVALCMSCHDKEVPLEGQVHKPIEENGCLLCHRGHDSEHSKLLRQPVEQLCLECHEDTYDDILDLDHVHQPFADKQCTACHTPHASRYGKLLVAPFAEDFYVQNDQQEQYGLCFECHDNELLDEPETDEYTNFRNGDLNLHYLHVNKETKGRSCRSCHLPHGSDQARLIRDRFPFGEREFQARYTLTETGGSCAAACHPAKRYDRLVPVDWKAEPQAPEPSTRQP